MLWTTEVLSRLSFLPLSLLPLPLSLPPSFLLFFSCLMTNITIGVVAGWFDHVLVPWMALLSFHLHMVDCLYGIHYDQREGERKGEGGREREGVGGIRKSDMMKTSIDLNRHQRTSPGLTIGLCIPLYPSPTPSTPLDRVERKEKINKSQHISLSYTIEQRFNINLSDIQLFLMLLLIFSKYSCPQKKRCPHHSLPPPSSILPLWWPWNITLNTKLWEPSLTISSNNWSFLNNIKYGSPSCSLFLVSFIYFVFFLSCSPIWISFTDLMIKDLSVIRREVEEHFERCIHALEARQHTLLTYLDQIAQYQGVFISLTSYHIFSRRHHSFSLSSSDNNLYMCRRTPRKYNPAHKRGDAQLNKGHGSWVNHVQRQPISSREHLAGNKPSSHLIFSCRPPLLIHSLPSLVYWYTNFLTSLFITSDCTQFEATKRWARAGLHECSSGSSTGSPSLHWKPRNKYEKSEYKKILGNANVQFSDSARYSSCYCKHDFFKSSQHLFWYPYE